MQNTLANTQPKDSVITPNYDRSRLKTRMVHIGFGAFHRAHQAVFTHRLAQNTNSDWGYCAVSLFSSKQIEHLREQEYLFSLTELAPSKDLSTGNPSLEKSYKTELIGSVIDSANPTLDGIEQVIEKLVHPEVAIVSLTLTEKGYCVLPGSKTLDMQNALIQHDLANPTKPKSAIGLLVYALELRHQKNLPAFTILSCDNMQSNGEVIRAAILSFAKQYKSKLAEWIEHNVSFPSSMVDRIVPAVTQVAAKEIEECLGVADPCGVMCEPFIQWVIEDNFVNGRPEWENVGVELVKDVTPYETLKLRLLNGSHSFLAYLGFLRGFETVSEAIADDKLRKLVLHLMLQEQAITIDNLPESVDVKAYANSLVERFANPHLHHKTAQIAIDGSQKLPPRLLNSVLYHLQNGSDFTITSLGIAGWMHFVAGQDKSGMSFDIQDPLATEFKEIYEKLGKSDAAANALLSLEKIFPSELSSNATFKNQVLNQYKHILDKGVYETIEDIAAGI